LVFLGLSVLDLGPMYATDVSQHHRLMPRLRGGGIITQLKRQIITKITISCLFYSIYAGSTIITSCKPVWLNGSSTHKINQL